MTELVFDGCCGEGGGARGWAESGAYVVGCDINPGCRDGYLRSGAAEFICADILEVLADQSFMSRFTFVAYHPPCQRFSQQTRCRPGLAATYPDLISPGRRLLNATRLPYVIENVGAARPWLLDPVTLCMWGHFGRETYRHRLIEAGGGFTLSQPPASGPAATRGLTSGIKPNRECGCPHPVRTARAGHWKPGYFVSVAGHERREPVRRVMEIDLYDRKTGTGWMSNRDAVKEAIPPYLGAWLAQQLAAWRLDRELAA